MAIDSAAEAMMGRASFVSFKEGTIVALLHVPIYKIQTSLHLYKYHKMPLELSNDTPLLLKNTEIVLLARFCRICRATFL